MLVGGGSVESRAFFWCLRGRGGGIQSTFVHSCLRLRASAVSSVRLPTLICTRVACQWCLASLVCAQWALHLEMWKRGMSAAMPLVWVCQWTLFPKTEKKRYLCNGFMGFGVPGIHLIKGICIQRCHWFRCGSEVCVGNGFVGFGVPVGTSAADALVLVCLLTLCLQRIH